MLEGGSLHWWDEEILKKNGVNEFFYHTSSVACRFYHVQVDVSTLQLWLIEFSELTSWSGFILSKCFIMPNLGEKAD